MIKKWLYPIIIGVFVALIMLFVYPPLRGGKSLELSKTIFNREPLSYNYAVKRAAPAVVNIYSNLVNEKTNEKSVVPLGSGILMSSNGDIITNYHVVEKAQQIIVALQDGRFYNATIVGIDKLTDIAALKIEASNLPSIPINLTREPKIGDVVLAIGNPYNIGQTITQGIISATGRDRFSQYNRQNFIQTDASINRGNSGGALVNTWGELVGINTLTFNKQNLEDTPEGIGFALPASLAVKIMQKLIKNGKVERGYLGIEGTEFRITQNQDDHPVLLGILVTNVSGPAEKAGILVQDILVSIDKTPVKSITDTMNKIADLSPNDKAEIAILRNGEKLIFNVTIEPLNLQ